MKALLFASFFVIFANQQLVHAQGGCQAINGRSVNCINVYDCPPVLSALRTRPLQPEISNYIRELQCGFDGYNPRVCCPPSLVLNPTTRRPIDQPTTRRPTRPTRLTPRPNPNGASLLPSDSECGADSAADRIYNGQITDIDEFPWMALLGYRRSNGSTTYECGGVLINRRYILTAAHCIVGSINDVVGRLITVRLGEYNTNSNPDCVTVSGGDRDCADPLQEIPVEEAIAHPGFVDGDASRANDIALVRLSREPTLNYFVTPICLANSNLRTAVGDDLYVAGWGRTLTDRKSDVKQKLKVPLFDKDSCSTMYRAAGASLTDNQICAGGEFARDTCTGDSGGPLMKLSGTRWYSIGVVSFGNGCGRDGWPGIYTSVEKYRSWITSNLRS